MGMLTNVFHWNNRRSYRCGISMGTGANYRQQDADGNGKGKIGVSWFRQHENYKLYAKQYLPYVRICHPRSVAFHGLRYPSFQEGKHFRLWEKWAHM